MVEGIYALPFLLSYLFFAAIPAPANTKRLSPPSKGIFWVGENKVSEGIAWVTHVDLSELGHVWARVRFKRNLSNAKDLTEQMVKDLTSPDSNSFRFDYIRLDYALKKCCD